MNFPAIKQNSTIYPAHFPLLIQLRYSAPHCLLDSVPHCSLRDLMPIEGLQPITWFLLYSFRSIPFTNQIEERAIPLRHSSSNYLANRAFDPLMSSQPFQLRVVPVFPPYQWPRTMLLIHNQISLSLCEATVETKSISHASTRMPLLVPVLPKIARA